MASAGGVGVVIINFNSGRDLLNCLESLIEEEGLSDIVVVDNGSTDASLGLAKERMPDLRIESSAENLGFGGAANFGATRARGDILLFMNPDVVVAKGTIKSIESALAVRPGVAGPITFEGQTGRRGLGGTINHLGIPGEVENNGQPLYVGGYALATNRNVFDAVGGFDARYFLYVEDVEYCWRTLIAGYDVYIDLHSTIWHRGGGSIRGGYPKIGMRYQTTVQRVALRERNTIAMLLVCASRWWLPFALLGAVLRVVGIAVASILIVRDVGLARSLIDGLRWNVVEFRTTRNRRKSLNRTAAGSLMAETRITRKAYLLRTLWDHGLPSVDH